MSMVEYLPLGHGSVRRMAVFEKCLTTISDSPKNTEFGGGGLSGCRGSGAS